MHPAVYREYERICREQDIHGKVLEIGAVPTGRSLLCMDALRDAEEKTGINLIGPFEYRDFHVIKGTANNMDCFDSDCFDAVLCNAVLEHDPCFWLTVAEMKRVLKKGGFLMMGTPGYRRFAFEKIHTLLRILPVIRALEKVPMFECLFSATCTLEVHDAPGDYYRFSEQAFRDVFFSDMRDVQVCSIMFPPRIIGYGRKPG